MSIKKGIKFKKKIVKKKIISKKSSKNIKSNNKNIKFDMASIKSELKGEKTQSHEAQIKEQRAPALHALSKLKQKVKLVKEYVKTGVTGFDDLFDQGIPHGSSVLIAGGAGSGKTILCLQILQSHALQ